MIATTTLCPLSKPAAAALHDLYLKVSPPYAALKVWNTLLNDEQRNRLGGDLEAAYLNHRTVGIVARARGISRERALIDTGWELGFLRTANRKWLLREVGESVAVHSLDKADAILSGDLVIQELPNEAYWEGEGIDIDWNRCQTLWRFLVSVARFAQWGRVFTPEDADDCITRKALINRRRHLKKHPDFPDSLNDLIESVTKVGYRLRLDSTRIHFNP